MTSIPNEAVVAKRTVAFAVTWRILRGFLAFYMAKITFQKG